MSFFKWSKDIKEQMPSQPKAVQDFAADLESRLNEVLTEASESASDDDWARTELPSMSLDQLIAWWQDTQKEYNVDLTLKLWWSFAFKSFNESELKKIAAYLNDKEYEDAAIYQPEGAIKDGVFFLDGTKQVEYTAALLFSTHKELHSLAAEHDSKFYITWVNAKVFDGEDYEIIQIS